VLVSTLSSTSTLTEINAAYDDNASYAEDNSVSKAKAFRTAIAILIRRVLADSTKGDKSLRFDREGLQRQLDEVAAFISSRDTSNSAVTVADFRGLRL